MTFKHDAISLPEALGVEQHQYAFQLATIFTLMVNGGLDRTSKASEMMHKTVDYNIILMLATDRIMDMAIKFDSEDNFLNNISDN